jgi:hypothetical protein
MRHNKRTNIYLIYNSLIRTISKAMTFESVENSKNAIIAKKILSNYFKDGILKEYVHIGNTINKSTFSNDEKLLAVEMLKETESYIKTLGLDKYKQTKIALLKEIKKFFNLDTLLEFKFLNYKTIASIHMFIEHSMGEKDITLLENQVKIRYTLAENMLKNKNIRNVNDVTNFLKTNKIDDFTLRIATNNFNKNLNNMNEDNKAIITKYLAESSDTDSYTRYVKSLINTKTQFIKDFNKYNDNIDLKNKLNDILSESKKINFVKDNIEDITEYLFDLNEIVTIIIKNTKE